VGALGGVDPLLQLQHQGTMFAMRLARAFTGRPKLAHIEGSYHSTHDLAEVSVHPDPDLARPLDTPLPVPDSPDSPGTLSWAVEATVVLPYNASTPTSWPA
jgi:glutamate-1-semialdehyde 2,1-aminomutase